MVKKYSVVFFILVAAVVVFIDFFIPNPLQQSSDTRVTLAQCLRDSGVVMYGAEWCPHCQNEKQAFGDAFKIVPYVECPNDPKDCLEKKIEGYPTWLFPDGRRLVGEQGIEKIAETSGCPL